MWLMWNKMTVHGLCGASIAIGWRRILEESAGMAYKMCGMVVGVMPNKTEDHLLYCPYEHESFSTKIVCEGPVPGTTVHICFMNHQQLLEYKSRFCRRKECNLCPIATVLNKKWGV